MTWRNLSTVIYRPFFGKFDDLRIAYIGKLFFFLKLRCELISDAVARMLENDIGRLLIVARDDPSRLVGYLGRSGIVAARQRLIDDENVRERGLPREVTS